MIQLKDLCQKASSNIAQKDLEGHEGQYPIYGASGLIGYVDFYKQENPYVAVVKDGAGIGRVMCLPEKSSVIGTMQYILPNEGVNVHYLAFAMEHMNLAKYFSGATIPHIYFKDYGKEKLLERTEKEQKSIAEILSKMDSLISLRKQQLAKLDELVKARFVEMFGDSVANTKNFPSTTLETVMTVFPQNGLYKPQTDYVQDDTGIPILRIDAFYNGKVTNWNTLKRLICSETEIDRYLLKENDIVINRVNSIEYLGKCAHIVGLKEKTVFESNMMRFHMDEKKVNAVYVTEVLCTEDIYRQILRRAKKSVNQASINQEDVKSLEILVPPLSLQNQFAAFVERVDQQKQTVQQSLEKLELMKKALMQEYFG
jgi:restriction endonuclease, S subunit